ncbi:glycoside hydrolase superfamily [Microdochium trichocladiopsis]|uniref:beta-glucosidase n=1 Tax=Microdochium trichocladiopsis TaxID=1682393 RepID=A0A9P8Y3C1_9PEZI|nr:glycoside hydrolase superfamily [Microdochium trichocladiopsis]KAH7028968.1 glycoside hydrolase superfamily [Microdochium trichocladiopsis]
MNGIIDPPAGRPPPVDIDALLAQLTLPEKISLLAGADWWTTTPIPRLSIPSLKFSDGPNGARGAQFHAGTKAACFPAAVSLAATFCGNTAFRVGVALSREAKTKGASVLLAPTVCMHRDPRGGRNFEAFSEDPFLAGTLAYWYILGLQWSGRVGASLKHFALNEEDTFRYTMDVRVDERTLRELYLRPFEIAVKEARPWCVMTSYNLVGGMHADEHKGLLEDVLRKEWGFKGVVLSDWGGTNSTAASLAAGMDLEMPGPSLQRKVADVIKALETAEAGLTEEMINTSAKRVLEMVHRAGKFADPTIPDERAHDLPETRELIRQVSADGMVLLRNEHNILPLSTKNPGIKSVALIGMAKEYLGHGGGSAKVNSHRRITPFDAITELLADADVKISYVEGARIIRNLPVLSHSIVDEAGNPGLTVRVSLPTRAEDDPLIYTSPSATFVSREHRTATRVVLTGTFTPAVTGRHYISFTTVGNSTVKIDGRVVFQARGAAPDVMAYMLSTAEDEVARHDFVAGRRYAIEIEALPALGAGVSVFAQGVIGVTLGFMEQEERDVVLLPDAEAAAEQADVSIVFVGHTPTWETEGCDRPSMNLPKDGSLDRLIGSVAVAARRTRGEEKKVIVVNSTGSPIAMPWIDDVDAVLQTWFPGQEAGYAIADVLFGRVSPGGKLPITFPRSIEVAPTYGNFPGDLDKRIVNYEEGVFMGYRHYIDHPDDVLYPFGYGLSYTTFEIADIRLVDTNTTRGDASSTIRVTARVTNTGRMSGAEVVQVYVGAVNPSLSRPKKELAGFSKARLAPGESMEVRVWFRARALSYWNVAKHKWSVDAGEYVLFVGNSSVSVLETLAFTVGQSFDIEV